MFRTLVITVVWSCVVSASAHAFTPEQARALSVGDVDSRVSALQQVLKQPDDKAVAFLQALADDAVKMDGNHAVLMRDGKALDPVSGTEVTLSDSAEDVVNNNRMRGEIAAATAACCCCIGHALILRRLAISTWHRRSIPLLAARPGS